MAVARGRTKRHGERGDSAFVSMTDLTVSFLFIVLVLLAFFAIHFRPDAALGLNPEKLRHERDNLKKRADSLAHESEHLKRENVEFKRQIDLISASKNQLVQNLDKLQLERDSQKDRADSLAHESEQLKRELLEHARENVNLKRQINLFSVSKNQLVQNFENLQLERDSQKDRADSLAYESERLKHALLERTRENINLKQEISQLQKTRKDSMPRDLLAEYLKEANSVRSDLLYSLGKRIRQRIQGIRVEVVTRDGLIRFRGDDLFGSGEWRIKPGSIAEEVAQVVADALANILPCYTVKGAIKKNYVCTNSADAVFETIQIEGHTDDVPLSENLQVRENMRDNLDLSARRGAETLRAIEKHRPDLKIFLNLRDEQVLSFAGYGDTRPIERDSNDDARAANRRIDIRFILQNPQNLQEVEEIRALIRQRQNSQGVNIEQLER